MSNFIFVFIFRILVSIILIHYFVKTMNSRLGSFFKSFKSFISPVFITTIMLMYMVIFTIPIILDFSDLIFTNFKITQCVFKDKLLITNCYITEDGRFFFTDQKINLNEDYTISYLARSKIIINLN